MFNLTEAANFATNYDFDSLRKRFPGMSNAEAVQELEKVVGAYDVLQTSSSTLAYDAIGSSGFNDALLFLEDWASRLVIDLFTA